MSDLVIGQVATDITNKMSAINLAVATHLSDHIVDEAIEALRITSDKLVSDIYCCYL